MCVLSRQVFICIRCSKELGSVPGSETLRFCPSVYCEDLRTVDEGYLFGDDLCNDCTSSEEDELDQAEEEEVEGLIEQEDEEDEDDDAVEDVAPSGDTDEE
ncbi:hypothetical protein OC835_004752 [Tilletia horrida]|nr:hypothetical protein OC835_004752 [Tilletia horrida]